MQYGNEAAVVPSTQIPVRLQCRDFASSYGTWRNVAVVLGRNPPEAPHIKNYRDVVADMSARHPGNVGLLTVVKQASTPRPEARDAMLQMFRDYWTHMKCAAFVVEGTGFGPAAQRGVIGALTLATGTRGRVRAFSNVPEAAVWMAERLLGGPVGGQTRFADDLSHAVSEFCRAESEVEVPA